MSYLSIDQCRAQGGACPRVCLDLTPSAACATDCYDGCYCSPSLYLLNGSCVPLSACPCYHQGAFYSPGASMSLDACNNWYYIQKQVADFILYLLTILTKELRPISTSNEEIFSPYMLRDGFCKQGISGINQWFC